MKHVISLNRDKPLGMVSQFHLILKPVKPYQEVRRFVNELNISRKRPKNYPK